MRLPWPRRKAKARPPVQVDPPTAELPAGEEVARAVKAVLLQGNAEIGGNLYLTNRRLLFEAKKGDARWMVVPWAEVKSSGAFPAPGPTMGRPASRRQCLFIETTKGEQVWWDFVGADESDWLPDVRRNAEAARAAAETGEA